ncbi:hypothetical protein Syun_017768 [Stephania yunnanensis]|uniref:Uncharacterized protein n=1 Tax=Stephania yunnanensis TaxID=152371 RepID=A0AAP0J9U6_9MAGN
MDDFYLSGSSNLRIGNRKWGSNGYVRTGRREARLVSNEGFQQDLDHAGSSRHANKGKKIQIGNGRRAKRAMKREAADRAPAIAAAAITAQSRLAKRAMKREAADRAGATAAAAAITAQTRL